MANDAGLFRSVLYIPGSKARALDKARGLPADAIIFDLEDAVAPDEKAAARDTLAAELKAGGYGHRYRMVRINGLDTVWGADDARAVRRPPACVAQRSPDASAATAAPHASRVEPRARAPRPAGVRPARAPPPRAAAVRAVRARVVRVPVVRVPVV